VELAAQLAAYAQTLAADLLLVRRTEPLAPLYRVYGYNRFQACRFGFEAELVDPYARRHVRLQHDLATTLDRLLPASVALGTTEPLRELARLAAAGSNDSRWLRETFAETHAMPDLVRLQAARWREGK
jgi:carboxylate-amine ligase